MSDIEGRYLGQLFIQEVPTGTVDGSNVTFNLSQLPAAASALILAVDGIPQVQGNDYTLAGQVITMATAPALGQMLGASYMKRTI